MAGFLKWPKKDPDEVLDYVLDWSARLDGDTIATSIWIVDEALTKDSDSFTDSTTTIWLSGGTAPARALQLTNRVTTAGGRTKDQTVTLDIAQK
jgi:hypothetical protein